MFTNRSKRRNREINISTISNIKATIENECKRKKGESIDLQTKLRIVLFLETTNDSQREIARKCNVGKSTVFRINQKLNQFKLNQKLNSLNSINKNDLILLLKEKKRVLALNYG